MSVPNELQPCPVPLPADYAGCCMTPIGVGICIDPKPAEEPPANVPTLDTWGIVALSFALVVAAVWRLR